MNARGVRGVASGTLVAVASERPPAPLSQPLAREFQNKRITVSFDPTCVCVVLLKIQFSG